MSHVTFQIGSFQKWSVSNYYDNNKLRKTGNIPIMLYTTSIFLQLFSILSQFQRFRIFYPYYSFYAFHSFDLLIAVTGNSQIIVKPKKTNYE